jgi:hypothetical protein
MFSRQYDSGEDSPHAGARAAGYIRYTAAGNPQANGRPKVERHDEASVAIRQ